MTTLPGHRWQQVFQRGTSRFNIFHGDVVLGRGRGGGVARAGLTLPSHVLFAFVLKVTEKEEATGRDDHDKGDQEEDDDGEGGVGLVNDGLGLAQERHLCRNWQS